MADKQRLFFALWPDEPLQKAIAASGRAVAEAAKVRGRLIPAPRIHLTLLFLGEVDAATGLALREAAAGISSPAFDLELKHAGSFRRSRVLWLGPEPTPPALAGLWLKLRDRIQLAGVPHDRINLSAHVTCLRDADRGLPLTPVEPIAWPVRDFVLVQTVPGGTSAYHIVERWPLAAP